jgi:hypothetical protein
MLFQRAWGPLQSPEPLERGSLGSGEKWPTEFRLVIQLPCNRFTSLPKEGMLRIFTPEKIRRLRPGLNP